MTRLIDAEEFRKQFSGEEHYWALKIMGMIDNAPTVEFPFVHVIINHPRYGECDGWLDKSRQLLFFDAITIEAAEKFGWTWKEDGK